MEKIITIRGIQFKCLEDGSCYKYKTSYWKEITSKETQGYIVCHTTQGHLKVHRIIACAFLGLDIEDRTIEVDHLDGNRSNNKVSNLRLATHTENCMNYNKKDVKGILQRENGNWRAYINHNKARYSKTFKTLEEAKEWRREKEIEFGYLHTSCL